jgi:hypothetical protein
MPSLALTPRGNLLFTGGVDERSSALAGLEAAFARVLTEDLRRAFFLITDDLQILIVTQTWA